MTASHNCEGASISAKYGVLCCVGTVTEDKIERRDTIQNMEGKREPSSDTTQVLCSSTEILTVIINLTCCIFQKKTICSTVNFGQEVGSSFRVKCTAIDFFCLVFPFCVCENED